LIPDSTSKNCDNVDLVVTLPNKAVWDFFDSSVVTMASSMQVLLFALARHEPAAFAALPAGLSALFLGSWKMCRDPGAPQKEHLRQTCPLLVGPTVDPGRKMQLVAM
jgi:hypothetical protein